MRTAHRFVIAKQARHELIAKSTVFVDTLLQRRALSLEVALTNFLSMHVWRGWGMSRKTACTAQHEGLCSVKSPHGAVLRSPSMLAPPSRSARLVACGGHRAHGKGTVWLQLDMSARLR